MQRSLVPALALICWAVASNAPASVAAEPETIPLWEGRAPGALGDEDADTPTLTIYRAYGGAGAATAAIVAPGGGYQDLAMNHEGRQAANWLNSLGITAFVLKYRLGPRYRHPIELGDAQRAMRLVRSRADEFGISPERIGMMGFSAGGHLATTAGTRFDNGDPDASDPIERSSSRPDFLILAYPVITLVAEHAHQGSAAALLGKDAATSLRRDLSSHLQVTPETPPTFLFATSGDTSVPAENSIDFYLALRRAGVAAEIHVFESGPHGVGLALGDPVLAQWPVLAANWLRAHGLIEPGLR